MIFALIYIPFILLRVVWILFRVVGIVLVVLARIALRQSQRKAARPARVRQRTEPYPTIRGRKVFT